MTSRFPRLLCLIFAVFALSSAAWSADEVPTREELTYGSISASITAVDHDTRSLMLEFEDGTQEAFVLDDAIEDLSKFAVGDKVLAGYARSLALELRPATEAEMANPLDVTEVLDEGEVPEGARSVGRTIRALTTIEELSRIDMTATLMGPMGNFFTVEVKNPARITQVRIGDSVVVTFTEAVVLTLQKAE